MRITGYDGTSCIAGLGGKEGGYDAVLVDAPCSSDRHVLLQAAARGGRLSRSDWSAARCSQLAELQTKASRVSDQLRCILLQVTISEVNCFLVLHRSKSLRRTDLITLCLA